MSLSMAIDAALTEAAKQDFHLKKWSKLDREEIQMIAFARCFDIEIPPIRQFLKMFPAARLPHEDENILSKSTVMEISTRALNTGRKTLANRAGRRVHGDIARMGLATEGVSPIAVLASRRTPRSAPKDVANDVSGPQRFDFEMRNFYHPRNGVGKTEVRSWRTHWYRGDEPRPGYVADAAFLGLNHPVFCVIEVRTL